MLRKGLCREAGSTAGHFLNQRVNTPARVENGARCAIAGFRGFVKAGRPTIERQVVLQICFDILALLGVSYGQASVQPARSNQVQFSGDFFVFAQHGDSQPVFREQAE